MRILIVEDAEDVACRLRAHLLDAGHAPVVMPGVLAALDHLEAVRPDAALVNLYFHFPGMSGFDFLRQQPVRESGVPIIALSEFPTDGQTRECLRLGALDCVDKRVSLDLLREFVVHLEICAIGQRLNTTGIRIDRRRSPRPSLAIPVQVVEGDGAEWPGECVNLSTFGIKIRPHRPTAPRATAKLYFPSPGGATALETLAVHIRRDLDGDCFRFVNLSDAAFRCLREVVTCLNLSKSE